MSEQNITLIELSAISGNPILQIIEWLSQVWIHLAESFQAITYYGVNDSIWWKTMYLGQFYAKHCPNWSEQGSKESVLEMGTKFEAQKLFRDFLNCHENS